MIEGLPLPVYMALHDLTTVTLDFRGVIPPRTVTMTPKEGNEALHQWNTRAMTRPGYTLHLEYYPENIAWLAEVKYLGRDCDGRWFRGYTRQQRKTVQREAKRWFTTEYADRDEPR